jgi:chaperonin GroEL
MGIYEKSKAKQIIHERKQLDEIVLKALNIMAQITGATLGPAGRTVMIERDGLSGLLTKDGVTVAKSLGVTDASTHVIIEAAKEICLQTAKEAGDGTTTAIVLADALVRYGVEFFQKNEKANPQRVARELKQLYNNYIVPFIAKHARSANTESMLLQVAMISTNGDRDAAEAVIKAVMTAGDDGKVLIEESQEDSISVETIDGYIVTSGLKDVGGIGQAFINDRANQEARAEMGIVFLYDGQINDLRPLSIMQDAILRDADLNGKPIVVVAHGFSETALQKMAKQTKSGYTVIPIKTPIFGVAGSASMFLQDVAVYTGGAVYDAASLDTLESPDHEPRFGRFERVRVSLYESFLNNTPDFEQINTRIEEIKANMKSAPEFHKMFYRNSIARLVGGVSTIKVGGKSDLEIRERKDRVEDAVEAVRSAIAEGVVPGGCLVHLALIEYISNLPEQKDSWSIMTKALSAPFKRLLENCGEDYDEVWKLLAPFVKNSNDLLPAMVFDGNTGTLGDPFQLGIIEPAKVVRVSIGNALSVASLLTTMGGMVVVPRDINLEHQVALSNKAFKDVMNAMNEGEI